MTVTCRPAASPPSASPPSVLRRTPPRDSLGLLPAPSHKALPNSQAPGTWTGEGGGAAPRSHCRPRAHRGAGRGPRRSGLIRPVQTSKEAQRDCPAVQGPLAARRTAEVRPPLPGPHALHTWGPPTSDTAMPGPHIRTVGEPRGRPRCPRDTGPTQGNGTARAGARVRQGARPSPRVRSATRDSLAGVGGRGGGALSCLALLRKAGLQVAPGRADPGTFRRRPPLSPPGLPVRAAWPGAVHLLLSERSPTHAALPFVCPGGGRHTPPPPGLAPEMATRPLDREAGQVHLTSLNSVSNAVARIDDTKKNHPKAGKADGDRLGSHWE